MSAHHLICKNCNNQHHGHYCNNCGQKAATHRIDLKHLMHDVFHALTHLDKGYLYTAKEMLLRPGETAREYLQGKRVRHPNPILMLIIIGGLCSLTYYNLELKLVSAFKIKELNAGLHVIDSKFFALLYFFYSIVLSMIDFAFFRHRGYNFLEFFIFNVFLSTEILLAQLVLVPVWLTARHFEVSVYIRLLVGFVFLAYLINARYQFYEIKQNPRDKWRAVFEFVVISLIFLPLGYRNFMQFFD